MIDLRKVYTVFLTEIQGNVIKKIMRAFLSERTLQKETETIMERVASRLWETHLFYFGVYSAVRYSIACRKEIPPAMFS